MWFPRSRRPSEPPLRHRLGHRRDGIGPRPRQVSCSGSGSSISAPPSRSSVTTRRACRPACRGLGTCLRPRPRPRRRHRPAPRSRRLARPQLRHDHRPGPAGDPRHPPHQIEPGSAADRRCTTGHCPLTGGEGRQRDELARARGWWADNACGSRASRAYLCRRGIACSIPPSTSPPSASGSAAAS
jgi:hypothetical protein